MKFSHVLLAIIITHFLDASLAAQTQLPAWDENWVETTISNDGPGSATMTSGNVAAVVRAECTLSAFGNQHGAHGISFTRKFTLPPGGPYCVEVSTVLKGKVSVSGTSTGWTAHVIAGVSVAPVGGVAFVRVDQNAHANYRSSVPLNGVKEIQSPPSGWTAFRGSGYIVGPGQYEVRGQLLVIASKPASLVGSSSCDFSTDENGFSIEIAVRKPAYTAQPATHNSGVICMVDGTAPPNTRRNFTPRMRVPNPNPGPHQPNTIMIDIGPPFGMLYDEEFAKAVSASLQDKTFNNFNFQFNQCNSGGMIDDLFHATTAPNIANAANKVTASASARHDQLASSNAAIDATCPLTLGSSFGRWFDYAIWTNNTGRAFPMGKAFWYAEYFEPLGPGPKGANLEHPQYKSNGLLADQFVIGEHQIRKAIVFVGHECSSCPRGACCLLPSNQCVWVTAEACDALIGIWQGYEKKCHEVVCPSVPEPPPPACPQAHQTLCPGSPADFPGYVRKDYYRSVTRIKQSLDASGYTTTYLAGPAEAKPCDAPTTTIAATRTAFLTAIAELPEAGDQSKEYYIWVGNHGFASVKATNVPNAFNAHTPQRNQQYKSGSSALGVSKLLVFEYTLTPKFVNDLKSIAIIDIEREIGGPDQPLRITAIDLDENPIGIVHDSLLDGFGLNQAPGETLFSCPAEFLRPGVNRLLLESLSPEPLIISALRVTSEARELLESGPPGDIDADGDIDATDLALFLFSYGQSARDALGDVNDNFNVDADYDLDGHITLIDYQIWYQLYLDYQSM